MGVYVSVQVKKAFYPFVIGPVMFDFQTGVGTKA
jgi:hypothetical protein